MSVRRILLAFLAVAAHSVVAAQDQRPNILLIVADDLGYSDLGVYGSEINTPNIDALAASGVLFTQFHTAPLCAPSRAMLLTGNNNHVAGVAQQLLTPNGFPGVPSNPLAGVLESHGGTLADRVGKLPALLRDAGYYTLMAGKWHLGFGQANAPPSGGFDYSYVVEEGSSNHFDALPWPASGGVFRENGQAVEWPENAYSTEHYTDKLIEYIDAEKDSGKPFFAYAAYTSPHWPLQVPDEDLDLYAGRYANGYDSLREERFKALRAANIIPADWQLPPRNASIPLWDELSQEQRRRESREMELYAAMVENLDRHVGRLLDHLRANDLYENTLIVFMSDNGPAGEEPGSNGPFGTFIAATYDNSFDNMGHGDSFIFYGPPWAEAGSAPFSRYKLFPTEGGIVAPLIVSGPGVAGAGTISREYVTIADLAPTFLEVADATYPDDKVPMIGESAWAHFSGNAAQVHDDDYVTAFYHAGRAFLRQGDFKLVNLETPFDERNFRLYDVIADPGETTDLSDAQPEIRAELIGLWRAERLRLGIFLPEDL